MHKKRNELSSTSPDGGSSRFNTFLQLERTFSRLPLLLPLKRQAFSSSAGSRSSQTESALARCFNSSRQCWRQSFTDPISFRCLKGSSAESLASPTSPFPPPFSSPLFL